jgi:hypothetical protein
MTEPKKPDPIGFILNIESVRLANLFFRLAFKATASTIALIARLVSIIALARVRRRQRRNRYLR